MDFSLSFLEPLSGLAPAEQKSRILATNRESWTFYGLQLSPADSEMILQTEKKAVDAADLIQFGEGITPKLIHWFLPAGQFGKSYAGRIAELTEAFYQIKGDLQEIYDTAKDAECMLSDNAILDYMYRLYTSPSCGGDVEEMLVQMDKIVVSGMRRLIAFRATVGKEHTAQSVGSAETRALYADLLLQEEIRSELEDDFEDAEYDYLYREKMRYQLDSDDDGDDYDDDENETEIPVFGSFAEELEELLRREPRLLIPSETQEAEWERRVEEWAEMDAAAAEIERKRKEQSDVS